MKFLCVLIGLFCFWGGQSVYGESVVTVNDRGVLIEEETMQLTITCLDERIVHIQAYPKPVPDIRQSLVVNDSCFRFHDFRVSRRKSKIVVRTSRLEVEYDKVLKRISFVDRASGEIIVTEDSRDMIAGEVEGEKIHRVTQRFSLAPKEGIYGLGQYQDGAFNYRGKIVNLVHANREIG